jgi:hypothetical protein
MFKIKYINKNMSLLYGTTCHSNYSIKKNKKLKIRINKFNYVFIKKNKNNFIKIRNFINKRGGGFTFLQNVIDKFGDYSSIEYMNNWVSFDNVLKKKEIIANFSNYRKKN